MQRIAAGFMYFAGWDTIAGAESCHAHPAIPANMLSIGKTLAMDPT
jgi:hypothetical protein